MIYKALINISKKTPDLFFIISKVNIIKTSDISTAAIGYDKSSDKFNLYLNESFISDFDLHNLSALIEHELLHLVLGHVFSLNNFKNKKLYNIATDAIINDIGFFISQRSKLNEKMSKGIFLSDLNEVHGLGLNVMRDTSLDIYNALEKLEKDKLDQTLKDKGFDDHSLLDKGNDETSKAASDFFKDNQDSFKNLLKSEKGRGIGNQPDCKTLFDRLEKFKKDKKIVSEIEKFISSAKTCAFKSTIKRPNRRYNSPRGKIKIKEKNLRLLIDTSGSMLNDETIKKMKKVLSISINNNYKVDLVFGDTKKQGDFKNISKNFDFSLIKGGGGTKLDFFCDGSSKYDLNIVLTDLEIDFRDLSGLKKGNSLIICTTSVKHDKLKTINI